jgi:cytochrome c-type biogenesis protein CcmI
MIMQLMGAAALLLLFCAMVLLWPRRVQPVVSLDQKSLFAEKLQLLVAARESGELSPADFQSAAQELKSQFLGVLPDAGQLAGDPRRGRWPAVGLVVVLTLGIYGVTGQYQQLQQWQQAQDQLAALGERALLGKGPQLSETELTLFALGLRTKLATSGDDAVAWFVLGRIWLSQGQVPEAIEALEKALKLTPERSNVLLAHAQALLVEGSEESVQKAARSLGNVLAKEPQNLDALSMLALIASERGDLKEARAAWEMVAQLLPAGDPRLASVQQQLAKLITADSAVAKQTDMSGTSAAPAAADTAATSPLIRVALTLSADTVAQYAGKTLFVFARSVDGPPLPVAVQKLTVPAQTADLTIELSNAQAMQDSWNLSATSKVIVGARVSASGSATPDPADLQVKSAELVTPSAGSTLQVELAL